MKILLIDDHALFRDGLQMVMAGLNEPLVMFEAGSCEAALDIIAEQPELDLVLLDLGLPGLNGMDALVAVQQKLENTPIVVLSGNEDPGVIQAALQSGAQGFIPKSSAASVMLSAVQTVLDGGLYVPAGAMEHFDAVPPAVEPGKMAGHGLTPRQADVLRKMADGQSNKNIGLSLGLSESTVRVHVSAILRSFNVSNRTQAVQHAIQHGWIKVKLVN